MIEFFYLEVDFNAECQYIGSEWETTEICFEAFVSDYSILWN